MKCPNCEETLVMTERQGVEIDYCPKCRGVWLDRGELDKIIDKSQNQESTGSNRNFEQPQEPYQPPRQQDPYYKGQQDPYYKHNDPYYKHKKKKGFLGDLFDFD